MGLHVPAPGYHHKPLDFMVVIGSTDGHFTKIYQSSATDTLCTLYSIIISGLLLPISWDRLR